MADQSEDHSDEIEIDPSRLTELKLLIEAGSLEAYLQAIGMDIAALSAEPPANA